MRCSTSIPNPGVWPNTLWYQKSNLAKFSQNLEFFAFLDSTGDSVIVEPTPATPFGCEAAAEESCSGGS